MKTSWSTAIHQMSQQGNGYVIATLIGVTGSTPRNSGSKMVITKEGIHDTIGGGHLEHKIIKFANKLLLSGKSCQQLKQFDLGIHLDQCCGGGTNVLFECFEETQVNIMLFGAGHVGQALVPILATLPCEIHWVDSREEQFPDGLADYNNVKKIVIENPQEAIETMPVNSFYIVMTHKHQVDFEICEKIFSRNDATYFGLIGSETKWRRFKRRFNKNGISKEQLEQVSCPIGQASVPGKLPSEIAVSIASEIIAQYNGVKDQHNECKNQSTPTKGQGVPRKLVSELIK